MDSEPFDYALVGAAEIGQGCQAAIDRAEALVEELVSVAAAERSFENTLGPLEEIDDVLGQASGRFGFLSQVAADETTRAAAHEWEEKLDTYSTGLGFREEIDRALKAYAAKAETEALPADAARLLEFTQRDYRRNGMELGPAKRKRVQELRERLVSLGIQFRRNIDEYDDAILVTEAELAGLPDDYVARLRRETVDGEERFRVSLDYPELFPYLEAADDRARREELFHKNHNKAADVNVALLEEAIALRDEVGRTLGYPSWAAYVLEIRMAKTPDDAQTFLADLEEKVRPKAEADMRELREVSGSVIGDEVAISDWRYLSNRVLKEKYQVDPFEVAEYFPLDAVLTGLFDVYQRLVQARFVPHEAGDGAQPWHADVRLYDIVDEGSGEPIAQFYMDLHPRPGKFGHAAAFTLRSGRELADGSYQAPISAIVANFTKPGEQSPSLLRHSEVVTLFHEFGHILHQTLTRSRFGRFSGTRVERDFVEAPSQMLEHWCWEKPVLQSFARHYRSGDPIPDDLVERMRAAKYVSSGIAALRQIYFGRLDLAYHGPGAAKQSDAIARELHPITGFAFPEETHFQAGFGHLFGYDAGYYGYMWSRVFGDDMFTRFEGAADPGVVGGDYRRLILEAGGTKDGDVLVREFLGRDPSPAAFLRDLGLDPTASG